MVGTVRDTRPCGGAFLLLGCTSLGFRQLRPYVPRNTLSAPVEAVRTERNSPCPVAACDGQIDADELQRCLTQSGIAGGYKLQRDMSGTMGFNEFKELWAVLNGWRQHFISFDSDRSGTVDPQELQKALTTMGFRLSPQAVNSIAKRYSTNGKITFDDYIACCVKLRALTDSFRRRDTAQQGVVNFPYDDVSPSMLRAK
ncbi:Sorcin [Tupaia chinensis]|uniref:Sorcin n=1 Tax=Tupaia chinensis TaxID=246437 RepID=L8Y4D6_TUPCH|nr:Sorcin [Tupaia chinensis]